MKPLYNFSNFLVCMAIGDAYCMAAEYVKPNHPVLEEALKFERYLPHPRWGLQPDGSGIGSGRYTDDTQMTIAVIETLLAGKHRPFDMAESFLRVYQRDPRRGYSSGFQGLLAEVNGDAHLFLTLLSGQNRSEKNGAAMRAIPFGVIIPDASVINALDRAEDCAALTHDSIAGRLSARAIARMAYQALYTELPFEAFPDRLTMDVILGHRDSGFQLDGHYHCTPSMERVDVDPMSSNKGPHSVAWKTVRAVLSVIANAKTIREAMDLTLRIGGDTDTVAALSCGLLGLRDAEWEPWMIAGLEPFDERFGAPFLQRLGMRARRYMGGDR